MPSSPVDINRTKRALSKLPPFNVERCNMFLFLVQGIEDVFTDPLLLWYKSESGGEFGQSTTLQKINYIIDTSQNNKATEFVCKLIQFSCISIVFDIIVFRY